MQYPRAKGAHRATILGGLAGLAVALSGCVAPADGYYDDGYYYDSYYDGAYRDPVVRYHDHPHAYYGPGHDHVVVLRHDPPRPYWREGRWRYPGGNHPDES